MGQNHVVQTRKSDSFRIPKWTVGCAIGFSIACVLMGISLGVLWLIPTDSTNETTAVSTNESDLSKRIEEVIREGTGNSNPKMSTAVAPENYEFPPPGSGDDSAVSFVFFDSDGDELVWQMTLTHPDETFEDGTYTMNISSQGMKGYYNDTCQVKNGQLTCSFVGRSPRFSETNVQAVVTRNNRVATSFWGRVSERKTNSGKSDQSNDSDKDQDNGNNQSNSGDADDQVASNGDSAFCPPPPDDGTVIPYDGTVSLPIMSTWKAGQPLKIQFDLSDPVPDVPSSEARFVLLVGDYSTEQCYGGDPAHPNRLTCEISMREEFANTQHGLYLTFAAGNEQSGFDLIGMCMTDVTLPNIVASSGNDHSNDSHSDDSDSDDSHNEAGIDCSVFDGMELEVAWPEWNPGQPLPVTFKFPGPVPGLESNLPGDWQYVVGIGLDSDNNTDYADYDCQYLGYHGKLHCNLDVPASLSGTIQPMFLAVRGCEFFIYENYQEYMPNMEGGGGGTGDHHDHDNDDDDDH